MKIRWYKITIILFVLTASLSTLHAQEELKPRPSPLAMVTMKYQDTYVKITDGRPHKKGREIFGSLVPYGKVWRTGANEATEITVTNDILIGGDTLKANTYTLFSIPNKDKWTIMFNKDISQWGAYNYNEKSDVIRIEVPTEEVKKVVWEPFTIQMDQRNSVAEILMMWDRTMVRIPVTFIDH